MRRKAVITRLKAIARLRSVIRVSGETLSERLARRPAAPREDGFGYGPVFGHWDAELAAVELELTEAEDEYARAKDRVASVRESRDQATPRLYQEQLGVQGLLQSLLDSRELVRGGIAGTVPRSRQELVIRAGRTVALLRRLERAGRWPADQVGIEVGGLIEVLEARARELETLGSEVEDARVVVDTARWRADEGLARADGVVPWITRGWESLCRLAGEDGLAGRVRAR